MNKLFTILFFVLSLTMLSSKSFSAPSVDPDLPEYQKTQGVSGKISSVGSDTLANLMTLWSEEFKRLYPSVSIQIQAAGSSTAPPALTEGTSNLGPMSRKMKSRESATFEKQHGYKALAIPVAIDALAVFVNKDNPIKGLTIPQVDAIFSSTLKCGNKSEIIKWSDLGISGALGNQRIQIFGRNSVSGTYGYFKNKALCKGDFKNNVNEQPGSASVVQSVSASVNSIGYSGIGYITAGVHALPISKKTGRPFVKATAKNAISGKYPLARFLYVYINKAPNKALEPKMLEFFRMILSKTGQEIVVKDGYIPLPNKVAQKYLKKIQ